MSVTRSPSLGGILDDVRELGFALTDIDAARINVRFKPDGLSWRGGSSLVLALCSIFMDCREL